MLSPINLPFIKPVWSLSIIDGSTFLNLFSIAEAIVNERRNFFHGLSEKAEYERPGPARLMPSLFSEAYISETVHPISIRSSQGDRSIQADLITVGIGSFGGLPWQVARAARGVAILAAKM